MEGTVIFRPFSLNPPHPMNPKNLLPGVLVCGLLSSILAADPPPPPPPTAIPPITWRYADADYEPQTPMLPAAALAGGAAGAGAQDDTLHGRVAPLVRITPENALADTAGAADTNATTATVGATGAADAAGAPRAFRATAWRNERVHAQFVLWSRAAAPQLRLAATALRSAAGDEIPAAALAPRFVRYVWAAVATKRDQKPGHAVGDILDTAPELDLPAGGFRPVWLTITIPKNTKPGLYNGTLAATARGGNTLTFPLEITVLPATLPDPENWSFFLDLWQHPWASARYHRVAPFSPEHYNLMEPLYKELAGAGQKVITTTITGRPWNQQTYDAYQSMVARTLNPDKTWTFDYTLFDHYVAFAQRCGLGPQIHCYSMVPWGNLVFYTDGATGDKITRALKAGTPEYEQYWAPFLADFQKHLAKKGWVDKTYIALDERSPEELRAAHAVLRQHAPRLKLMMAGNKNPADYQSQGITIDNYSQILSRAETGTFLDEIEPRRRAGNVTTYYVCVVPLRPNTFTYSPCAEQVWLGYYAAAKRFDGMLRWAFAHWPREPLWDSSFRPESLGAGDTFLIYPGPRLSVRWEMFRDGIEEFEKIRLLRENNPAGALADLEKTLAEFSYKSASQQTDADLAATVARARAAVETASRLLR
jgi:hypothetical protein